MTPAEICAWSERQDGLGKRDAIGCRWTDWKVAVRNPNGTCARDQHGHQIFETQDEFKARSAPTPIRQLPKFGETMDLFA